MKTKVLKSLRISTLLMFVLMILSICFAGSVFAEGSEEDIKAAGDAKAVTLTYKLTNTNKDIIKVEGDRQVHYLGGPVECIFKIRVKNNGQEPVNGTKYHWYLKHPGTALIAPREGLLVADQYGYLKTEKNNYDLSVFAPSFGGSETQFTDDGNLKDSASFSPFEYDGSISSSFSVSNTWVIQLKRADGNQLSDEDLSFEISETTTSPYFKDATSQTLTPGQTGTFSNEYTSDPFPTGSKDKNIGKEVKHTKKLQFQAQLTDKFHNADNTQSYSGEFTIKESCLNGATPVLQGEKDKDGNIIKTVEVSSQTGMFTHSEDLTFTKAGTYIYDITFNGTSSNVDKDKTPTIRATYDVTASACSYGYWNRSSGASWDGEDKEGTPLYAQFYIIKAPETGEEENLVKSLNVTPTELNLTKGTKGQLTSIVKPESLAKDNIKWTTTDSTVAIVDNYGNVTAKSEGDAIISASAADESGKIASCLVTVEEISEKPAEPNPPKQDDPKSPVKVSSISVKPSSLTLDKGDTETLKTDISPSNAANKAVTWSSSKPDNVSVDKYNGKVKALKANTSATITATAADGSNVKGTSIINVNPEKTVEPKPETDNKDKTEKPSTIPSTPVTPNTPSFGPSTPSVPSAPSAPSTTAVTGVKINKTSASVKQGETVSLSATVEPTNATNKKVSWSSSDVSVAKVDANGVVTAVAPGSAKITVKTADGGKTASCVVTVIKAEESAKPQPKPEESDKPDNETNNNTPSPQPTPTPSNPGNQNQNQSQVTPEQIYRLYLPGNNEHLYTSDANEAQALIAAGWSNENVGWNSPSTGDPVYRLYSPVTNEHHYTKDPNEVRVLSTEQGWSVDNGGQPLFYSGGDKPIYRLYHEGTQRHHLTTDVNEYNQLGADGWNKEGTALNALS